VSWSFEASLAAFLGLAFAAHSLSTLTRSKLSLQFWLGALCFAGFASSILPADLIERSRMREVGVIAFNVLVVHSGTMIDLGEIGRRWKAALLCLALVLPAAAVLGIGLGPILGRELAAVSPGPTLGGGAAAAIASNALSLSRPELAAYPWIIFMLQCLFGLPLFSWALRMALRRDGARAASEAPMGPTSAAAAPGAARALLPERYRTTAYHLGSLMLVALFNKWLYSAFLSWTRVGPVVTALVLGIALRAAGILERDPLGKSDSFGLLMLGLMALMAQAFAKAGPASLLSLVPAALLALALASLTVAAAGALAGRLLGLGAWTGLAAAAGCLVGLPLCVALVQEAATAVGDAGATQGPGSVLAPGGSPAAARLLPQVAIAASLMGNVLSIVLASLAGAFVR
jgi:hypothetical protein